MKILFTGDINFRDSNNLTFETSQKIICGFKNRIETADFVIPNLECPLGKKQNYIPIKKSGPNLICEENNICFLKALNSYAVTLANNHIGDYGYDALFNTVNLLEENGIAHVGAGKNLEAAYAPLRISKDGISVSVISVCENEFGIATKDCAGSAGYNPRMLLGRIKAEKALGNYVVTVFHGGNEFNPLPSPDTVERYKLICDMGADAIIGGHTHCPQGYEMYNGKPIIYSMGNLLFKSSFERDKNDSWYYGYVCMLNIAKSGIDFEITPYKFNTAADKITVFEGKEKEAMLTYIQTLSKIIQSPDELKKYFMGWAWNHKWVSVLPQDFNNLADYNSSDNYNLQKCESHFSQSLQLFETLFYDETETAIQMAEKVKELQTMPV